MKSNKASLAMWDSMAQSFARREIPDESNNFTLRLIQEHKMCPPGSRVLDVGCGAGKYAIALELAGASVVATDFSQKMLDQARRSAQEHGSSNIEFSMDDWPEVDLAQKGWHKAFDLVLCSMSPALNDHQTLQKAIDASRGWLLITKPCRRTMPVTDGLTRLLGLDPSFGRADDHIQLAFSALWEMGGLPLLAYNREEWFSSRPLEEAVDYYTKRLSSGGPLSPKQCKTLREHLAQTAVEGMVEERTQTTVTAIFCRINNE